MVLLITHIWGPESGCSCGSAGKCLLSIVRECHMCLFFFTYLFGCIGLSCSTCNLPWIMQDFSLCWMDSSHGSQALEWAGSVAVVCRVSCSTPHGVIDPQPGVEPVSPALQGRFLVAEPPGKSLTIFPPVLIQLNLWTCVYVPIWC